MRWRPTTGTATPRSAIGFGAVSGASGPNGPPSVSLTTTQAGSLVYGVGNDWDNAIARTVGANQAIVHQYLAPAGDTMWVQNGIGPVAAAGTLVQLNDTAPTTDRWNFAGVEIVPAPPLGFQVNAYNDSITLGLSDSGTYNLLISPTGNFTGSVYCSVSGLPADATGIFEPPNGPPHPGPFALIVNTGSTTPRGTYQPIVTCTGGTFSARKTLALMVTTDPDFRVVVEPNSLTVSQGLSGVANFQIQAMNSYAQQVSMGASGLPSGVSTVFTPSALVPSGAGTVQLVVGGLTAPGVYELLVTATDGFVTRQAAFQLTVVQRNTSGSWRQQALGDTPALYYGVVVGDVGNTGKNRVYASGGQGVLYEYSFDGSSWSFSRMPVGVSSDSEMHNMAIGTARNDGVSRLYIAVSGGDKVYECSWVSARWQCPIIVNLTGATDIIIGDGRNDGVTRMYVSWMSGTTEFTWTGTAWTQVTMSSNESGWVHGIDLGTGRNDGINRVYTANQGNGQVYEYSWNGAAWGKLLMGSTTDTRNVEVAQGRNDGKFRVYTPSGDSNVYEFTWTGSAWQQVSIGNAGVSGVKVQSIPAKAKRDGLVRIYGSSSDAGVDDYTWTGSAWQTARLGRATAYMYGLAAGDGLNKGTIQIYGASYDGNAYLFEWMPATVTVPNVLNLTQAAATTAIVNAGLTLGTVSTASNSTVPAGSVFSQNPLAGTEAAPGSAVNLVVSSGAPTLVPNVVNLTQADATAALTSVGLAVGTVSTALSATVRAGAVISQSPVAGTQVASGGHVDLVVSSGVTVPNVVGQPQSAVASILAPIGLIVGTVNTQPSQTVPIGVVISQTPAANAQASGGSAVNLVVSSGVSVPNVVGQPQSAVAGILGPVGLVVGTVTTQSSATVPVGVVISQLPAANTQVSGGSAVNLVVSSGPPPSGPTVDKVVFSDGAGSQTLALSTSGPNEVLIAFAASDGPRTGAQALTVSGGGLTWTLVRRSNTRAGTSEIWKATAAAQLANVTVTSTQSASGYDQSLTVVAFAGATGTGASAIANGATGAPSVTLITTKARSLVYGVGNDWDRAVDRTLGPSQTMVHIWVDTASGDTYWVQAWTGTVANSGVSIQLNDTAPTSDRWNFASVEIVG